MVSLKCLQECGEPSLHTQTRQLARPQLYFIRLARCLQNRDVIGIYDSVSDMLKFIWGKGHQVSMPLNFFFFVIDDGVK
jgi:hypothetical protein